MEGDKDKKIVASTYIGEFYRLVQNLNHWYALYKNVETTFMNDHKGKKAEDLRRDMEETEYKKIKIILDEIRYNVNRAWIGYKTIIATSTKVQEDPAVKEKTDQVNANYVVPIDLLEDYIIMMNKTLLDEAMKNLIKTSQDYLSDIYDNE